MVLYLHHTMHSPHRPGKTLEEKQMQGKNGKKELKFCKTGDPGCSKTFHGISDSVISILFFCESHSRSAK